MDKRCYSFTGILSCFENNTDVSPTTKCQPSVMKIHHWRGIFKACLSKIVSSSITMDLWATSLLIVWTTILGSSAFTPSKDCGKAKVVGSGDRIVGGRETVPGEFPWQVSLQYKLLFRSPVHMCGASVLNERWILTAAHCVHKKSKWNLRVVTGMYSLGGKDGSTFSIDKVVIHEKFNPETFLNDIALLRTKKRIAFKDNVNSICLPYSGDNATGITTVSGWGDISEGGGDPSVLMAVELPLVPQAYCESLFGSDLYKKSSMLCAGYPQGGRDSCQGHPSYISGIGENTQDCAYAQGAGGDSTFLFLPPNRSFTFPGNRWYYQ